MPYDLYPAVDQNYDFPIEVRQALARSNELRSLVIPMTSTIRNNLLPAELWDGRVIANTTTDRLERYDSGLGGWYEIADATEMNSKFDAAKTVPSGFRNVVRNGDFSVAQRGDGPFTAVNQYCLDGILLFNVGGTLSVTRSSLPSSYAPQKNTMKLTTTGQSLSTHYAGIIHVIDDVRTLAGKVCTLSFYASADTGTPKIFLYIDQKFGTGGSPAAISRAMNTPFYTLNQTLQKFTYTFTMPSIAGKQIGANENSSLALTLIVSEGTGGSIGIQNNGFYITDIQLEAGDVATAFERLPVQQQLAWCCRYMQRINGHSDIFWPATNLARGGVPYQERMRALPTITVIPGGFGNINWAAAGTGGNAIPTGIVPGTPGTSGFTVDLTGMSGAVQGGVGVWQGFILDLSAEIF